MSLQQPVPLSKALHLPVLRRSGCHGAPKHRSKLSKMLRAFAFWLQINLASTGIRTWTWKFSTCLYGSKLMFLLEVRQDHLPADILKAWRWIHLFPLIYCQLQKLARRFVYEVWFISWREATAFFSGNGLVPIHCVTNPWYIRHHAKYSGLQPTAVDTLKVAASPAISCPKKSSIHPLFTSNGS